MLFLGAYWSITTYNDWIDNPVLTTVKTSALKIENIDFPALTICSQGVIDDILMSGFYNLFYKYAKQLNISYGMSPIRTVRVLTDGPKNPDEIKKIKKIYDLMANESDSILKDFFDIHLPGIKISDRLREISPVMASMNPYAYIRMTKLKRFGDENLCLNITSNEPTCSAGYSLDSENGVCYKAINETRNIWDASYVVCSNNGAKLVWFNNDNEVQGVIKLLKNGNK